jgi:hypothetical protein
LSCAISPGKIVLNTFLSPFRKRKEITMVKELNSVVVTDIKMPFSSMVVFMVKWAIATIPALIILAVVGSIVFSILGYLGYFIGGFHHRDFM